MTYYETRGKEPDTTREENKRAALTASLLYKDAVPATTHGYLDLKKVKPFCTRLKDEKLVVPALNFEKEIQTIQTIYKNGTGYKKEYLRGGKKQGTFCPLSPLPANDTTQAIGICEGYATGASIQEALPDTPILVCFDAWNMRQIAHEIRARFPKAPIHVFADNDLFTYDKNHRQINTGQMVATRIKQEVKNTKIYYPYFKRLLGKETSDFNDMHCLYGIDALRKWLNSNKCHSPQAKGVFCEPLGAVLNEPTAKFEWLWEDCMLAGGTSLIAAQAKTGKSCLIRNLIWHLHKGGEFLGKKVTKCEKIMYVALDESQQSRNHAFKRLLSDKPKEEIEKFHATVSILRKERERELPPLKLRTQAFRKYCEQEKPDIMIVDTLKQLLNVDDSNNEDAVYKMLKPFLQISAELNIHICVVVHMRKVPHDKKPLDLSASDIRGSGAYFELVDTGIFMHKDPRRGRFLWTENRVGKPMPKTYVEYDANNDRIWLGEEVTEDEEAQAKEDGQAEVLLKWFQEQGEGIWFTKRKIREECKGLRHDALSQALHELYKVKQLLACRPNTGRGGGWEFCLKGPKSGETRSSDEF